ncbi:MAG: hypothetical protein AAFN44_12625 [Pseudomonadota bacterium]
MAERFEAMLTGGHPNSLRRTIELVDTVLADPGHFDGFFACYSNADEGTRLQVTNAMTRVEKQSQDLLVPHLNRLADDPRKSVANRASKGLIALGKV